MTMADTIAVMNAGRIEQLGAPDGALRATGDRVRRRLPRRFEPLARDGRGRGRDPARRRDASCAPTVERPLGRGRSRSPAGEDHDRRGRRCQRASRHDLRDRLHRSGDAGRRSHGRGHRACVRAEHGCGRARSRARDKCRSELGSGVDVRRRPERLGERGGGARMNPRLTRQELLRRGAAGGALLAFPSLLAACGGGGGSERRLAASSKTS